MVFDNSLQSASGDGAATSPANDNRESPQSSDGSFKTVVTIRCVTVDMSREEFEASRRAAELKPGELTWDGKPQGYWDAEAAKPYGVMNGTLTFVSNVVSDVASLDTSASPTGYRGFWHNVGSTAKGYFINAPINIITNAVSAVVHYDDTLRGLGHALVHPVDTSFTVVNGLAEKMSQGNEGVGEACFDIVTMVIGGGGAVKGVVNAASGLGRGAIVLGGSARGLALVGGGTLATARAAVSGPVIVVVNSAAVASGTGQFIIYTSAARGAASGGDNTPAKEGI